MNLPTTHYDMPQAAKDPVIAEKKASPTERKGLLKTISFYMLLAATFLAPLVFIPSAYAPLDVVKAVFLSVCVLVAAILYVISEIKNPTIVLPRSVLGYAALGIVLSLIISALQSSSVSRSLIGQGFESGSASYLLVMILAAFLLSRIVLRDSEKIFKIYTAFFISFLILVIFQVSRMIFGADFLDFGILSTTVSTLAGKWYDFAIIVGAAGLLSFITLKFLTFRGILRVILYIALVASGFILFVANATFIWAAIAFVTAAIGVYEYATRAPKGDGVKAFFSRISIFTFIVFLVAVVAVWKGDELAAPLMKNLKAEYAEAILPWQLTLDVTSNTLKESPLFGAGPNRFGFQYLRYKPLEVNQTIFWGAEFSNGFGVIPTYATTQGLVGIIVWGLFLIFFAKEGVVALRRATNPLDKFFLTSSFFIASFLWLALLVYPASHSVIFLTYAFTGLFAALLLKEGIIREKIIPTTISARSGKLVLTVFSIGAILLFVWFGVYAKKAIALTYFQKGIKELNANKSPDDAEGKFRKALLWDNSDVYYQALTEMNIMKVNALAQEIQAQSAQNPQAAADPKKVERIVSLITESMKYARAAEKIDPTNYYNYVSEARVSEIGVSLQIPNAYENAKVAYSNALQINPYNPSIYLALARLEASQNKVREAQQYIGSALRLKSNYVDAVFLLSQLQAANNQLKDALVSTKVAIQITPNEPLLHFQLGLLEYNDKNYTAAIPAFEKAIALFDQYANARYFLGLSYARLGNTEKAIAQFAELAKTNPDNQEVAFILSNLERGKSPFADVKPPIDNKPEKRQKPPVTEKNGKKVI